MELALRSNKILSEKPGSYLEQVTAAEDSSFDLELEMLYRELTNKGKDELEHWKSIYSYKNKLMNCYNTTVLMLIFRKEKLD
jgi:hypothetical protein